jgi:DNA/RNA-binding domain of Phe-tRNA-synthetase-like protein
MQLTIDPQFTALFPDVTIGCVSGRIRAERPDARRTILELREAAEAKVRALPFDRERLTSHPHIGAWRAAYQKFGVKAKSHQPTHEALVRRILKDGSWPDVNPIVDVYLTNQAFHVLPHGGYDAATIAGPIRLAVSPGDERFVAIGGEAEVTKAGEVVYRDDARILTRRWNYRDGDATKITPASRTFVLMIESPSAEVSAAAVEAAGQDLVERYRRAFDGDFAATTLRVTPESREFSVAA